MEMRLRQRPCPIARSSPGRKKRVFLRVCRSFALRTIFRTCSLVCSRLWSSRKILARPALPVVAAVSPVIKKAALRLTRQDRGGQRLHEIGRLRPAAGASGLKFPGIGAGFGRWPVRARWGAGVSRQRNVSESHQQCLARCDAFEEIGRLQNGHIQGGKGVRFQQAAVRMEFNTKSRLAESLNQPGLKIKQVVAQECVNVDAHGEW